MTRWDEFPRPARNDRRDDPDGGTAREVGKIQPGAVIECPSGSWKFAGSPYTLFLRVEKVREDLSAFYEGEVWLEGQQLARDGTPMGRLQALVTLARIKVLRAAAH